MKMDNKSERALLIGTRNGNKREWDVSDALEELSLLAETAGACVAGTIIQELKRVDASLLIGGDI
jgi:50S ribosomal subunit-associated GTPase HflX